MRKLLVFLLLLAGLLSACQMEFLPSARAATFTILGGSNKLTLNVLTATTKILQNEYYKPVVPNKLLNGSVDGFNEFLKEKKKKVTPFAKLSLKNTYEANFAKIESYLQQIKTKYPNFSESDLIYAALKGMLFSLDDPYTVALTPKENKLFTEQMGGGNFTGVGIYLELDKKNHNQLTVMEPIEGTPAEKAGLKSGDSIMAINGESTKGIAIDIAAQKIRGPQGSTVLLKIKRKGQPVKDYPIVRQFIHVNSVITKMYKGQIGYLKLRVFGENTQDEFGKALEQLEKAGAEGLVLDLRNNGGGYVQAAVSVCSFFLPSGTLITSLIEPRSNKVSPYNSFRIGSFNKPVIVLVNRYSASASEITAGAFKDTKLAPLLGEKSFGKGSVQSLFNLPDGGAVKYTIAHYRTPSGADIHEKGIKPNITVEMDPQFVGDKMKDKQLLKAVKMMQTKLAGK